MKLPVPAMIAAAVTLACAAPAFAAKDANAACDGKIDIVRVSRLKPGATLAQFQDAVAAHMAWYRKRGMSQNTQVVARVLDRDAKGEVSVSPNEVMTIHLNNPRVSFAQMDPEWEAYVAKYRAVSDIVSETIVCDSNE